MTREQAIQKAKEQYSEIWECSINHPKYEDTVEEIVTGVIRLLKYSSTDDCISLEVYKQVVCERDIAIEQLKELGYELGEKIETSDDCVSRKRLMDNYNGVETPVGYRKVVDMEVIKNMPPVTPTQRWIPVSERLPEDRNLVLVTAYWHETYQVMMASYYGDGLWWCVPFNNCGDHMQKLNPKAWMPLPKPYEEKRGTENG